MEQWEIELNERIGRWRWPDRKVKCHNTWGDWLLYAVKDGEPTICTAPLTRSLDACAKWVWQKLPYRIEFGGREPTCLCSFVTTRYRQKKYNGFGKRHALAFCRAVEQVMEGE